MRFSLRMLLSFTTAVCLTLATWRGDERWIMQRWAWFPCYWIACHFGVELLGYAIGDLVGWKSVSRRQLAKDDESRDAR